MGQYNIDDVILNYFKDKKDGFFVEIGVADPIVQNNTYILEERGWKGILVEPISRFKDIYFDIRPNSIVESLAMVSKDYDKDYIFFNDTSLLDGGFTSEVIDDDNGIKIKCDTLENVLIRNNIKNIDFLSIDVEGYEINVMNGIDLSKFNIETILIEIHTNKFITTEDFDYLCEQYNKEILNSGFHVFFTKK